MFFVLSKVFGFFASPSNLVILVGILGLLLLPTRFARTGQRLAFLSIAILAILGLSPIGNALIISLENRLPAWDGSRGAPDGIVVLSGAIEPLAAVAGLARSYPNARILVSGGSGALSVNAVAEAKLALRLLERLAVARYRITPE